jgi:hypothetical protein
MVRMDLPPTFNRDAPIAHFRSQGSASVLPRRGRRMATG